MNLVVMRGQSGADAPAFFCVPYFEMKKVRAFSRCMFGLFVLGTHPRGIFETICLTMGSENPIPAAFLRGYSCSILIFNVKLAHATGKCVHKEVLSRAVKLKFPTSDLVDEGK